MWLNLDQREIIVFCIPTYPWLLFSNEQVLHEVCVCVCATLMIVFILQTSQWYYFLLQIFIHVSCDRINLFYKMPLSPMIIFIFEIFKITEFWVFLSIFFCTNSNKTGESLFLIHTTCWDTNGDCLPFIEIVTRVTASE